MFRMNGNTSTAPRSQPGLSATSSRTRTAKGRARRRDDATFIAIAALLAILFVTQTGWVVAQQADRETSVSHP